MVKKSLYFGAEHSLPYIIKCYGLAIARLNDAIKTVEHLKEDAEKGEKYYYKKRGEDPSNALRSIDGVRKTLHVLERAIKEKDYGLAARCVVDGLQFDNKILIEHVLRINPEPE